MSGFDFTGLLPGSSPAPRTPSAAEVEAFKQATAPGRPKRPEQRPSDPPAVVIVSDHPINKPFGPTPWRPA